MSLGLQRLGSQALVLDIMILYLYAFICGFEEEHDCSLKSGES